MWEEANVDGRGVDDIARRILAAASETEEADILARAPDVYTPSDTDDPEADPEDDFMTPPAGVAMLPLPPLGSNR